MSKISRARQSQITPPRAAARRSTLRAFFYSPQAALFKHFRNGLIYFSVGCIVIYIANASLPASLQQEVMTLAGLIMCAFGFVYAMFSYLRFSISRFLFFFKR